MPVRGAFANWEINCKSLVSGSGSNSRGGRGGGSGTGGGDIGSGAGQSPYPLQAFCNSSNALRLVIHFPQK